MMSQTQRQPIPNRQKRGFTKSFTHVTSAGIGGFMVLVAIKVNLSKADT